MSERFFIVGAQRSATTYLYHLCDEHPQIEMAKPVRPEPKFFLVDELYARGLSFYDDQFFSEDTPLRGEKSTSYYEVDKVAQRIAESFPQARIIFLLRDPIRRALSNYAFSVSNGFETLSIEEAFRGEGDRWQNYDPLKSSVSPFAYLRRGLYITYIRHYEQVFPASQIKVVIQERLVKSPALLRELYAFLGVDAAFIPPSINRVANPGQPLIDPISEELRAYLTSYFAEANASLEAYLHTELIEWRGD